jgi:hypothetical protein
MLEAPHMLVKAVLYNEDIRPNWPTEQFAELLPQGRAAHAVWAMHADELRGHLRAFVCEHVAGGEQQNAFVSRFHSSLPLWYSFGTLSYGQKRRLRTHDRRTSQNDRRDRKGAHQQRQAEVAERTRSHDDERVETHNPGPERVGHM